MRILPRPFGQVLSDAVLSLGRNWKPLVITSIAVFIPATALTVLVFNWTGTTDILRTILDDPDYIRSLTNEEAVEVLRPVLTAFWVTVVIQAVATLFVFLVSHRVIAGDVSAKPVTGSQARREALRRYPMGLLVGFIAGLVILGAFSLGLILWNLIASSAFLSLVALMVLMTPGVWLTVVFSMLTAVVGLEKKGVAGSLNRTIDLVKGRWGATLGFVLLVGLLGSAATSLIQAMAPLTLGGATQGAVYIVSLIGIAGQGFIVAAVGAAYTQWYIDLRSRKEPLLLDQL